MSLLCFSMSSAFPIVNISFSVSCGLFSGDSRSAVTAVRRPSAIDRAAAGRVAVPSAAAARSQQTAHRVQPAASMSEHSDESTAVEIKEEANDSDPINQINNLLTTNGRVDEAPAFNMRLIAMVKARPYLYDHTNEGYNVTPWRNAAWQEIADSLESTPEGVKTRWKTLRDRFKKEEKKEKVTGKASSWTYQKPLKFVHKIAPKGPQIRRDSAVTPSLSDEDDDQVSPMEAAISFIEQEIIRNGSNEASTSSSAAVAAPSSAGLDAQVKDEPESVPPVQKRARVSLTDSMLFARSSQRQQWSCDDEEDDMFARMIAARLSKLSDRQRDKAKIRVLSALYGITDHDSDQQT